ncbi:MAG: glycosyltransferase family 4 protein [Bacteroidales bacterium]|nr:glycosyltransferase family 4 protein [Bacteroidales bacterium]MBN2698015.1 glycosyltransferase family 4 protein [Bacteroidales bacterium]
MNAKHKRIAIIGPYPPPFGGISVHIQRILTYLPEQVYDLYNVSGTSGRGKKFRGFRKYFYIFAFLFRSYTIIHYHSTSKRIRLLLSLIAIFKKGIYLHLHGASFSDTIHEKSLYAYSLKRLLKYVNILASNETIYNEISGYGPGSIAYIDAFIPPKFDREQYDRIIGHLTLPRADVLILMIGWFAYYNNQDLYGFDLMLNALRTLKVEKHYHVRTIASVNGIKDRECYDHFLKRREELNLIDDFILISGDLEEIYPLFLHSDIFVRPTNTDGNAVSIKEALWFDCRVIASDAVVRPPGVVLFENRNHEDLSDKIEGLIRTPVKLALKERIERAQNHKTYQPKLLKIYGLEK